VTDALHVPARDIPVPTSISDEAQMMLSMFTEPMGQVDYPAIGDRDAWRDLVKTQDEVVVEAIAPTIADVDADRELRSVGDVGVFVFTPRESADDRVVLEIHGGGFLFLGGEACALMGARAVGALGLPTWAVDYRMPPDHPYPAALDDCLAVYTALLAERSADRIIVSGGSAGGNLAAALLLRARDEGLPMPGVLLLVTPEVDLTESGDSFHTNAGVDTVCSSLMPVNRLYANGRDLAHPYLSPLFGDLTGFPPTILSTGTRDLFLSNTVRMHRALRHAGAETELHVFEAAPHGGFMGMAPEDGERDAELREFIDRHCPRLEG
jgi:acetyl esterase/lipase